MMSSWVRYSISLMSIAAMILSLSIYSAYAQDGSAVPDVRSKQGQPCGSDADCATGLTCFNNGRINYCTGGPEPVYHAFTRVFPRVPAKTCNTASDCGPGDWHCSNSICGYTGEKRCSTNSDCHGGWICEANGNGHACMPPQP
jgi:hypothetical protein